MLGERCEALSRDGALSYAHERRPGAVGRAGVPVAAGRPGRQPLALGTDRLPGRLLRRAGRFRGRRPGNPRPYRVAARAVVAALAAGRRGNCCSDRGGASARRCERRGGGGSDRSGPVGRRRRRAHPPGWGCRSGAASSGLRADARRQARAAGPARPRHPTVRCRCFDANAHRVPLRGPAAARAPGSAGAPHTRRRAAAGRMSADSSPPRAAVAASGPAAPRARR